MSMEVDLSTPLTEAEYTYLVTRGRQDQIERAHAMHGTSDADYADALSGTGQDGPRPQPMLQGEARAARRERLQRELEELDAAEANADAGDEDEDGEPIPYEDMTVPALDKELKARELPVTGSKADKIKRLEEDDAAA